MLIAAYLINRLLTRVLGKQSPIKVLLRLSSLFAIPPRVFVVFALVMIILLPENNWTPVLLSVSSLATHPPKRDISVIILLHVSGAFLRMLRFMKPTLIFCCLSLNSHLFRGRNGVVRKRCLLPLFLSQSE